MIHPLRQHLLTVVSALQSDAMTARVMGRWGAPNSRPTGSVGPVANTGQLRHLRDVIGGTIPDTLLEVLEEVSANIEIAWVMRGHYEAADWGKKVVTDVTPPDPFLVWSQAPKADGTPWPGATRNPFFISGSLRFSIEQIEQAYLGIAGWQSVYADDSGYDADTREHLTLIRDFMGAGLPVMVAANGDWLAIDQRDDSGCLLHVSHEGEEAGMEIDLTLPNFIAHQSWLGPVTPDFSEVFQFANSVKEVIPGDYRLRDVTFDAASENGRLWRDWFWADTHLAPPDPALLRRCADHLS